MDDHALMARVALGDTDALSELIDRHRAWAEDLAESILHDRALAEDAVQEAFTRVYLLRSSYQPTFAFRTYLGAIVRRICIDLLRRMKAAPVPSSLDGWEDSAEEQFLRREKRLRLWSLIDSLGDQDRRLLVGFALEGRSCRELAQQEGMSGVQVRVRLHRIRKRLHQKERDEE